MNLTDLIIENALHGKLEFVYTDQPLNENTVQLAEGLKPFHSLFPTNTASILDKLYFYGVRYIGLRSVGHDYIDLKEPDLWALKWRIYPYSPIQLPSMPRPYRWH
jgi:D-lactate dehydrogenase